MFGNNEVTSGGRALKFFSSVRLDVRRVGTIKEGDKFIGNRVRVKTAKNKVAPPLRQVEFDVMYGEGISRAGDLLDLAFELNVVLKSASWYSYNEMKLGQGRDRVKLYLESNEELLDEIEDKIRTICEIKEDEDIVENFNNEAVEVYETVQSDYVEVNKEDTIGETEFNVVQNNIQAEELFNIHENDVECKEDLNMLDNINDELEVDEVLEGDNNLSNYETEISFIINDINEAKGDTSWINDERNHNEILDNSDNTIYDIKDELLPDALRGKDSNNREDDKKEASKEYKKEELNQPQKPNQINLFDFFGFDKTH